MAISDKQALLKQLRAIDARDMRSVSPAHFRKHIRKLFTKLTMAGRRTATGDGRQ